MATTTRKTEGPQKYVALANRLTGQIEAGVLKPGDRLPSLVNLRRVYGASQSTAERAYALLERDGLIVRKPNRGIFVAEWRQSRRQCVLGVSIPAILRGHPYYERIVRGIQSTAHEEKVELLFLREGSTIKWEKVDGVILAAANRSDFEGLPQGMPTVSLFQPLRSGTSVIASDFQAVRMLVDHLTGLGHRRIAYFASALVPFLEEDIYYPNHIGQHRLNGYYGGLRAAGIEPDPAWVRPLRDPYEPMKKFEVLGREGMSKWLSEDWDQLGCTAIMANNDEMAVGIIEVLLEKGIRIPDDISVVGFDGLDIADYFRPRLTTAEVPLEEIGAQGARLLIEQIRKPLSALHTSARDKKGPVHLEFNAKLRIGESSGPCPKSP